MVSRISSNASHSTEKEHELVSRITGNASHSKDKEHETVSRTSSDVSHSISDISSQAVRDNLHTDRRYPRPTCRSFSVRVTLPTLTRMCILTHTYMKTEESESEFLGSTYTASKGLHTALSESSTQDQAEDPMYLTFKGAISAIYSLLPSLTAPSTQQKFKVTPMSQLPSDDVRVDTSALTYFPQSLLVKDCVRLIHESWWDTSSELDVTDPRNLPPNADPSKPLDIRRPPLPGFKDLFYRDPNATLPLDPPKLGHDWERSVGKTPRTVMMSHDAT